MIRDEVLVGSRVFAQFIENVIVESGIELPDNEEINVDKVIVVLVIVLMKLQF